MPKPVTSKAGSAPIVRQGHTSDGSNGSGTTDGVVGRSRTVRDLKVGSTR